MSGGDGGKGDDDSDSNKSLQPQAIVGEVFLSLNFCGFGLMR